MKKALAILLTLALLLGLTGTVLADDEWITLRVETFDRNINGLDVTNCWQLHYAQEHFGDPNHIKLEFVSYSRWDEPTLLTNDLQGGTACDICPTYGGPVQQCIDDEGIWQLDALLDEYGQNLKAFLGETLLEFGRQDHDGDGVKEQWFIPARRISVANVGNFIRQDWLDALNMEKPTTVEEFTNYLRAAKEAKLAGENTMPFSFGIFASNPMFNVRRYTDAFVDFSQVTKEDWVAFSQTPEMLPGAKEGFRWLNMLYNEGIIPETFALQNNDDANDTAKIMGYNGFWSEQPDQPWRTDKNFQIELEKNVPGGHWVTVNCFQNDSLGGKTLHDKYAANGLSIIIPKTTDEKTAIAAIKYLDWMAIPENMFALQNGVEGINYEGISEEFGIPYGVKSADNVPDEYKIHAGDICFIANGYYYGDDAKNAAALALPFAGYEKDVQDSYVDSLTDAWTQVSFIGNIQAQTDYGDTVKSAEAKFLADVVSCAPEKFDEVFDAGIQNILKSGAQQMIDEFRAAFQAGNYRGEFPGEL